MAPPASSSDGGPPKARLLCLNDADLPDASCRIIPIAGDGLTIGRDAANTYSLLAHGVSRKHAKIFSGGDMWGIKDVGSTNGVIVNGARITETWLRHGDTVEIGNIRYKYLDEGKEMPEPKVTADEGDDSEKTVMMPSPVAPVSPGAVTQEMAPSAAGRKRGPPPRSTRPRAAEDSGSNVFLWILGALALILLVAAASFFI
ncbi:MAG: FHA domain-containing protein [Gammaproteobacteria bacterium]|nr:FHA domain-containing protein [Gammaproteobacteria bacterium]